MADAVAQDSRAQARGTVPVQIFRITQLHHLEVHSKISNVAANIRIGGLKKRHTGTFETFIDDLEKFALLRVHIQGFHIVDAEEVVFKRANVVVRGQEVATGHVHASRPTASTDVVESVDVEA